MKNNKNSGLGGFLQGKGFYAALAVCLLGAVAAAWVTVDRTIGAVDKEQPNISVPENRVIEEEKYDPKESLFAAEDVAKPKEDVKIEEEEPEETFNFVPKKQSFALPLEGKVITEHSDGELVKYEALGEWRTHDGIDLAAAVGTEVKAAADGKVTAVRNDPLWGTVIEIDHKDNIITLYSGLAPETAVKEGDEVKMGDLLGTLGETNLAEVDKEAHLHFAMKKDGKFIDPSSKIK